MRIKTHVRDPEVVPAPVAEPLPRAGAPGAHQLYLKKGDFEGPNGAGFTDGCQRCRSMRFGLTATGAHSDECRAKMMEHLK